MAAMTSSYRSPTLRRSLLLSLGVSSVCHVALGAALLLNHFQPWDYAAYLAREAKTIEVSWAERRPAADETAEQPEVHVVTDPDAATGEMVRERIDELAAEAAGLTDEQKQDRLDKLTGDLNRVADAESIDQLATRFQGLLGTSPRATQPIAQDESDPAQAAAAFDFDTAQIHDVKREAKEDGGWRYWAVLLDAQGRTLDSELDAAAGEQLFLTMQRIKSNPLLEKVYRQIAMPLFDQMLSGMKTAARTEAGAKTEPKVASEPPGQVVPRPEPGNEEGENPFDDRRAVELEVPPPD